MCCHAEYGRSELKDVGKIGERWNSALFKSLGMEGVAWYWNPRDAFRGQSRSPNTVPFHIFGIVSSWAILTFSLRRAILPIFDFENVVTLKSGSEVTQGHWKWYHSIDWVWFPIVFYRNFVPKMHRFSIVIRLQNAVTLKTGLGVRQGHWKCHHSIERIRLPIDVL